MLGAPCSPCCCPCSSDDGKPCTDPADEGTWTPSGSYPNLTWTYSSSPSESDGGTWFFYGSAATSKVGGSATTAEQQDWGNLCNWYSRKNSTPSLTTTPTVELSARATRLPPSDAIVHVYSAVSTTSSGPVTVKTIYFHLGGIAASSNVTATDSAYDTTYASVFFNADINSATLNGGALFLQESSVNAGSTVNGGAEFDFRSNQPSLRGNFGTVNDGAVFRNSNSTAFLVNAAGAVVNGGAQFLEKSTNNGTVNDGAIFTSVTLNAANQGTVNGGAIFNSSNNLGGVNGGAVFNGTAANNTFNTVNDGAVFNDTATHTFGIINGGAVFNDQSRLLANGTVNDGATFNDAACSERTRTVGGVRFFVAHPTDFPTCNGTAPAGSDPLATCGCN